MSKDIDIFFDFAGNLLNENIKHDVIQTLNVVYLLSLQITILENSEEGTDNVLKIVQTHKNPLHKNT